jgi:hypothetical protein
VYSSYSQRERQKLPLLIDCTWPGVKEYMRKADLMPDLVDQVLGDLARGVARFLASRDLWHSQMTTLSSG